MIERFFGCQTGTGTHGRQRTNRSLQIADRLARLTLEIAPVYGNVD